MESPSLHSVRTGDTELHYVEKGTGEPVVLVHGTLDDYRSWTKSIERLSTEFRVIAYSRRGYYPNQPTLQTTTVSSHSSDLSALISEVSKKPVHLVGHSYGAYVVLHCALHNPARVKSLVASEPPISPLLRDNSSDRAELSRIEAETIRPMLDHYAAQRPDDAARIMLAYLEKSLEAYDSLSAMVREIIRVNSPAAYAELRGGLAGITRPELREIRPPTLLMKTEFGPTALRRIVDLLFESIPNAVLMEVRGASHGSIDAFPDYLSSVRDFLARS